MAGGTFSDSWKLTKTAFGLIRQDRALLVFPLVAGLAILGVLALFILGILWTVPFLLGGGSAATTYEALAVVLFLVMYFLCSFISVYATAALVGAATLKLNGEQPTAADGWRIARSKLGTLLVWSLISATVGLVIQAVSRRLGGIVGVVAGAVGGATWTVVTYFMIPVLIYESDGAWTSIKRSAKLFISTFGRSIVSNLVVGLIVAAGIIVAVLLGVAGVFLLLGRATVLGVVLIGLALAAGTIFLLIGAAAEGILRAALYRYATTGKIDPDLLPKGYAVTPRDTFGTPLA
ncbi:MAG: DUF6159 family protein [Thermoplasmata archaeon]